MNENNWIHDGIPDYEGCRLAGVWTLAQLKKQILQLEHKGRPWTSEQWYLGNPLYLSPDPEFKRATASLIKDGAIYWQTMGEGEDAFPILVLDGHEAVGMKGEAAR